MTTTDSKSEQAAPKACCANLFGMPKGCGHLGVDCLQMMSFATSEETTACCEEMLSRWRQAQHKEE